MATANRDAFPYIDDGDVMIVTSTKAEYRLESQQLKRASRWFKDIFETYRRPKLSAAAKREGKTPWAFQLAVQNDVERFGRLIFLHVSDGGAIKNKFSVRRPAQAEGDEIDEVWRSVLGIFYGVPPALDTSTLQTLMPGCVKLVTVSISIDAGYAVRQAIDLLLMRHDNLLWQATAQAPATWIKFAFDIQSPKIFKDAVCHAVGKWRMLDADTKVRIPDAVQQLCQKKFEELQLRQYATELRLCGYFPNRMYEQKTKADKDMFAMEAVSLFRQFFAQAVIEVKNCQARDLGFALYKGLSEGGEAYLDRPSLQEYYKAFSFTPSGKRAFEARLDVVKEGAKSYVANMMERRTQAVKDESGESFGWFTCALVTDEDLPWAQEKAAEVSDDMDLDEEDEDKDEDEDEDEDGGESEGGG